MIEHADLAWMRHLMAVERAELEAQVRALWGAGNDAAATDLPRLVRLHSCSRRR